MSFSFEQLYTEYKKAVFCYAYHLTRDRHEADDLFQETWVRIAGKIPEKEKEHHLKAWIFTVATNIYRDNLRKKRVRRLFLSQKAAFWEKETDLYAGRRTSPQEMEGELSELNRKIFKAVQGLPEKQRTIFILKEISGFRQTDIGDILGIPVGTVKSLMHRAVKKLQRELMSYRPDFFKERGQNEV